MKRIVEYHLRVEFYEVVLEGLKAKGMADADVCAQDLMITPPQNLADQEWVVKIDYEAVDYERTKKARKERT